MKPKILIATSSFGELGPSLIHNLNKEFEGLVERAFSIIISKNNTHTVIVQHGNFFSVYKNLTKIYVSKGDNIYRKDIIGEIFTDAISKQTILSFSIFKDGKPQDPSQWIYKM